MGLDSVELVMDVEDTFGLSIPDRDASQIETVGQFFDYLMQRLGKLRSGRCSTQHTFYRLRSALVNAGSMARSDLRLDRRISELPPVHELSTSLAAIGLKCPPILSPLTKATANSAATFLVLSSVAVVMYLSPTLEGALIVALPVALFALWLATLILRSHSWHPHRVLTTGNVRELVTATAQVNSLQSESAEWTEARVWQTLQTLICEQMAIPREKVVRDAHFVRDLGMS